MRVILALAGGSVEFTEPTDAGPYPFLLAVGTLRMGARAGQSFGLTVGESPSLDLVLDNNERQTSPIIGYPLRVLTTVTYDDRTPFFAGVISKVVFGRTITISLTS